MFCSYTRWLAKILSISALTATTLLLPTAANACTQFWIPSSFTTSTTSATGTYSNTYLGRSEDHAPRQLKTFAVQERQGWTRSYESAESGFVWAPAEYATSFDFPTLSYRYTYLRDHPGDWDGHCDAYSEAGINEVGLCVSATLSTDYNELVQAIDPVGADIDDAPFGDGEYVDASIMLGECNAPRMACELLGKITTEYGAYSCDQVVVANSEEAWLFNALSGHEWVAFKLDTALASVNPNMSSLTNYVNLSSDDVLASPTLITTAQSAGAPVEFDASGRFNYAAAYGVEVENPSCAVRYAQGRAYLADAIDPTHYEVTVTSDDYSENGIPSLSALDRTFYFMPQRTDFTLMEALRAAAIRGETAVDTRLNANADTRLYAIGNYRTVESHMFEIMQPADGSHSLIPELSILQWEALTRDEFSISLPSYSALLTSVSPYYSNAHTPTTHQGEEMTKVDDPEIALEPEPANILNYVLMDLNSLCYANRETLGTQVRDYLDAVQTAIISEQTQVTNLLRKVSWGEAAVYSQEGKPLSLEELATKAQAVVTKQTYLKLKPLLDKVRAYLQTDQESRGTFTVQDYDMQTQSVRTPLGYYTGVLSPFYNIDPQPTQKFVASTEPLPLLPEARFLAMLNLQQK